ncbi:hypothetical protein TNCV_5135861 [Trichonephila clavipes]|nr:hypothetical protein TNCV_5135861 [Trichonephila clavipes]
MLLLSSSSVWRLFLKETFFRYPQSEKFGIDKSGERGGQSPLEMIRSSRNSVKTSILSRDTDGLFIGLVCKVVSISADGLTNCFLSATNPVSRNRCSKRVIFDAFGAVPPGYFF